jgi:hypothetical protein
MATMQKCASKFGDNRTGCCITTMHSLTLPFSPGNFLPKNNSPLFPQLKIKLNSCHLNITEVITAESQAVFYTLTEHDLQDVSKKKKKQKHWEQCIRAEGGYFKGDGGQ